MPDTPVATEGSAVRGPRGLALVVPLASLLASAGTTVAVELAVARGLLRHVGAPPGPWPGRRHARRRAGNREKPWGINPWHATAWAEGPVLEEAR